jgi:hypothetical protein
MRTIPPYFYPVNRCRLPGPYFAHFCAFSLPERDSMVLTGQ